MQINSINIYMCVKIKSSVRKKPNKKNQIYFSFLLWSKGGKYDDQFKWSWILSFIKKKRKPSSADHWAKVYK